MKWLLPGGRSIRQKLITIVLATTFLALAIAGAILVVFDLKSYQESLESDLATQADIVGTASMAALAFDDPKAARENLWLLRASSAVSGAAVYKADGSLFATFARGDAKGVKFPLEPAAAGARFEENGLGLFRPILSEGELIGTVYLLGRDESMARLQYYLGVLGIVMAISLLTALLLTNRLQASLTRPVTAISDVARRVMEQRDYSLRADRTTDDEIGVLVDAFNDMLTELGRRAQVLEGSNRALHESDERYQLAVRGSSAGLWDWNIDANQVFLSPSFKELVDYAEGASGKGIEAVLELLHPEDRVPTRRALDEHLAPPHRPYRRELRIRTRSGEHRWFYMSGEAVAGESGKPYRMAGSIIDIHGRKAAEAALHEANRRKDEFIATLAHELRNPLAPIRTGLQILGAAPAGSDSAVKAREIIERQLIHMVRLVDDLLDISRITSAKVKLDKAQISVQQAVEASIEASAPYIAAAGQQLTVSMPDEPIPIFADLTRMAQAIGNILNNAAKYTPRGGHIGLAASREGDEAVIRISDNGAGIPADMLDRVFDMFTQVGETMSDAQGGLGIGLSIVRRLIDLHEGSVQATSGGPGHGSEFTIRLPCAQAQAEPDRAGPAAAVGADQPSQRVLVVDDNIDAARTMVMLLQMSGHRASMVHNGPDALAAATAEPPDAILLDIGLPGMNGYEVARRMRAEPVLERTALIALTGWGSEADKRKAIDAGFDTHLTKPVGPDVVLDVLARIRPSGAHPVDA
jgi:PAS domain S-box-containing protein